MTRHHAWEPADPADAPPSVVERASEPGIELAVAFEGDRTVWRTQAAGTATKRHFWTESGKRYSPLDDLLWSVGLR